MTGKGWVAAGDLVVGDEVYTLDGDASTVQGFKLEKLDKPISVYNLEVEDFNSYFVGDGVLVHNYKKDIEDINKAAKEVGVDRKLLGKLIHTIKKQLGMGAAQNFDYDEIIEYAKELIGKKRK